MFVFTAAMSAIDPDTGLMEAASDPRKNGHPAGVVEDITSPSS